MKMSIEKIVFIREEEGGVDGWGVSVELYFDPFKLQSQCCSESAICKTKTHDDLAISVPLVHTTDANYPLIKKKKENKQ